MEERKDRCMKRREDKWKDPCAHECIPRALHLFIFDSCFGSLDGVEIVSEMGQAKYLYKYDYCA